MAVDLNALRNHPGANPKYKEALQNRQAAQSYNRENPLMAVKVPPLLNKYVPHTGAKEMNRHSR